jgi:hypothetical protein
MLLLDNCEHVLADAPGHDVNPADDGASVADVGAELEAIEVVCADDVPVHSLARPTRAAAQPNNTK